MDTIKSHIERRAKESYEEMTEFDVGYFTGHNAGHLVILGAMGEWLKSEKSEYDFFERAKKELKIYQAMVKKIDNYFETLTEEEQENFEFTFEYQFTDGKICEILTLLDEFCIITDESEEAV